MASSDIFVVGGREKRGITMVLFLIFIIRLLKTILFQLHFFINNIMPFCLSFILKFRITFNKVEFLKIDFS